MAAVATTVLQETKQGDRAAPPKYLGKYLSVRGKVCIIRIVSPQRMFEKNADYVKRTFITKDR